MTSKATDDQAREHQPHGLYPTARGHFNRAPCQHHPEDLRHGPTITKPPYGSCQESGHTSAGDQSLHNARQSVQRHCCPRASAQAPDLVAASLAWTITSNLSAVRKFCSSPTIRKSSVPARSDATACTANEPRCRCPRPLLSAARSRTRAATPAPSANGRPSTKAGDRPRSTSDVLLATTATRASRPPPTMRSALLSAQGGEVGVTPETLAALAEQVSLVTGHSLPGANDRAWLLHAYTGHGGLVTASQQGRYHKRWPPDRRRGACSLGATT